MTASIIIQMLSIVMIMLLAVPGTQWIWETRNMGIVEFGISVIIKFHNQGMVKKESKVEVNEITKHRLFTELSKIAAAIF